MTPTAEEIINAALIEALELAIEAYSKENYIPPKVEAVIIDMNKAIKRARGE